MILTTYHKNQFDDEKTMLMVLMKKDDSNELIIREINNRFSKTFNLEKQFIDLPLLAVFPDFKQEWIDLINDVVNSGQEQSIYTSLTKDYPIVKIDCYQPKPGFCTCVITDCKLTVRAYHQLIEDISDIVFCYDIKKGKLYFFKKHPVYSDAIQALQQNPKDYSKKGFIHIDDNNIIDTMMKEVLKHQITKTGVVRFLADNGMYHWHSITITSVDEIILGYSKDINEEKKAELTLINRAERDSLTNLYNRGTIETLINEALINEHYQLHGLIIIDVDNFRDANNIFGHFFGDIVLLEIGRRLLSLFPNQAYIGRLGGDEFAVFIKNIKDRHHLEESIQQVRNVIQEVYSEDDQKFHLTSSLGGAIFPNDGQDFLSLFRSADTALYLAKDKGRNCYHIYDQTDMQYCLFRLEESHHNNIKPSKTNVSDYLLKVLDKDITNTSIIQTILQMLTEKYNFSRSYILEVSEFEQSCEITHNWEKPGIPPRKSNLESGANNLNLHAQVFDEEGIYFVRSPEEVPAPFKQVYISKGIKALIQFAIYDQDKFKGFIGFEDCIKPREFSSQKVSELKLASRIIEVLLKNSKKTRQLIEKTFQIAN